ncbi:uncharacterized protein LOC133173125 [Saccostrea echinata]|uniref:uncharacterized protein LOC133173125 n=1 Tax=Saccostrea echinata TaxID=191078 RepID=UPI002A7F7BA9|nr:uncharacterized protein LOC133173125 [Saccostrea echinata]
MAQSQLFSPAALGRRTPSSDRLQVYVSENEQISDDAESDNEQTPIQGNKDKNTPIRGTRDTPIRGTHNKTPIQGTNEEPHSDEDTGREWRNERVNACSSKTESRKRKHEKSDSDSGESSSDDSSSSYDSESDSDMFNPSQVLKMKGEMVQVDPSSFFGQGPQTTDTSLGATVTEDNRAREAGVQQSFLSPERQKISRNEDNKTAMTYINKMGGTVSKVCNQLALDLWEWCLKKSISMRAEFIPGRENVIADWETRHHKDSSSWGLDPYIFQILMNKTTDCKVDLFADRTNAKLDKFISWMPDPEAVAHNALLHPWVGIKGHALPPFCLISQCLSKIQREKATILLVTPAWPAQPWYATILKMCIQDPILLPIIPNLLMSDKGEPDPLVRKNSLQLVGWVVSGDPCKQCIYHKRLKTSSVTHGERAQHLLTIQLGKSGLAMCQKGREIDPFSAPIGFVLDFLSHLYYEGFQYRTINVHRAAISSVMPHVNNLPIGQHSMVKLLMRGILRGNPPLPRYKETWDVDKVLNYFISLPSNEELSLKLLSKKLAMLLAIAAQKRVSEIARLDKGFMQVIPSGVKFLLPGLSKTQRDCHSKEVFYARFPDNKKFCVVECLLEYLQRTKTFRNVNEQSGDPLLRSVI